MFYIIVLVVAAFLCCAMGGVALRARAAHGAPAFAALALALAVWSLGYAFELLAVDLPTKIFWSRIQYLGITALPAAWLAFACRYTHRDAWLDRRGRILLSVEPALVALLFWTNPLHGLVWRTAELLTVPDYPLVMIRVSYGPVFWIHILCVYAALLVGTLLMGRMLLRSVGLIRRQTAAILLGALIPWVGNAISLSAKQQLRGLDLTPLAFAVSAMITGWALLRYRLLNLVPVARETLIERLGDGVLVLDEKDQIVDLNPAACRITGQHAAELIGQSAATLTFWEPARGESQAEQHREIMVDVAGEQRVFELGVTLLTNRSGRRNGCLVVLHDITELYRAKEAAEVADRAKSAFLATVTHELRTPLQVIDGYTDLIKRDLLRAGATDNLPDLERIQRASSHLLALIDQVLDLSSIEAGRLALSPSTCAIRTLVDEAVAEVQPLVQQRLNQLEIDAPETLGELRTDARRLRQVLVSVLHNAAKFTERGTIALRVRRSLSDCPVGACVEFCVADSGIGMSEEQLRQVFQLFNQADNSSTRQYGGMGLGLALSQRLCRLLGAEISASSRPGQGTTVTIRVPGMHG